MAQDNPYGYEHRQLAKLCRQTYPPVCYFAQLDACKADTPDIDLTISGRARFGWTMHHLDPVAVIGSRTPDISRVRPAHRACNSAAQDRVTDSPRSRKW